MTSQGSLITVAILLTICVGSGLLAWWQRRARLLVALMTLSLAAMLAILFLTRAADDRHLEPLAVIGFGCLAVLGGGPVTRVVFELVDGPGEPGPGSVRTAGQVLRGGAWIGALERLAIFSSLMLHWPEGLALTLALKGLGRYPELRNQDQAGIAERFLIGTFVSVLWAALCALACFAVFDLAGSR